MSRFIIADVTDAKSIPQELQSIVPDLPSTTRNHVQSVLNKSEVHSRLEAVAYACQMGFIEVDD